MNAGGKCLKQRIQLKMTLGELARDTGISVTALRGFEHGSIILSYKQIEKIADALMLKCEYVLNDKIQKKCKEHSHGYPCFFNGGIECFDMSDCYKCAWNPEVARARRETAESGRAVLYENFIYGLETACQK